MTVDPLLVDTAYPPDRSCWARLAAAGPPWHGAILKASHGTRRWTEGRLATHWPAIRGAAGKRYGVDFFRGAYHYLLVGHDGAAQADVYLSAIEAAGGWDVGDLWPIVDVEEGNGNNQLVAARQDGVSLLCHNVEAFAARIRERTGRDAVLYFGGWLRELGLRERLGCAHAWIAAYTPTLPAAWWRSLGFVELWGWQYAGAMPGRVDAALAGYPRTTPIGPADISALTLPGGIERLRATLWAERPG